MGIHIIPCVLGERKKDEYTGGIDYYIENERYKDFDSVRCVGDKDFINTEEIEWEWMFDNPSDKDYEWGYRRPKDINFAINWIKENNPNNYVRMVTLLESMKKNDNIWIRVSH